MHDWRNALVFVFLIWLWEIPCAWAADDPNVPWEELESEHFVIHYPKSREIFAKRALMIAEEAHQNLVPHLEWNPQTKTHISVTDHLDEANGWARSTPRNEIRLYTWPPEISEELGYYNDWMRQLIYHEYTHILHTDTSNGLHSILNALFGKFARNNAATPKWYTEGLAVYYETLLSQSGRLRNVLYRIMLRNAALAQNIPTLGALSTGLTEWPGGTGAYLYGAYFMAYMAQNYGRETLSQWNKAYGNDWIPYAMNRAAVQIWSKTWDELYEEWRQSVYQEFEQAIEKAQSDGPLTPSHRFISPWRHERPQVIPQQNAISYVRNTGTQVRAIVKHDLETHDETLLTQCWGRCEYRWSDDGNHLIFTFAKAEDGYKQHETLYHLNLLTNKISKLQLSGRIRAFDLDQNNIYRVVQVNEAVKIYKNTIPETEDILIYEGRPFEQIDEIAVNHGEIIASRFDPNKRCSDIYRFKNQIWLSLTNDQMPDISPYWRRDGRIGYVSIASGEMNLWSMDVDGKDKKRHTHLLNGILHVSESNNGDIYYTTYTAQGTTIAVTKQEDLAELNTTQMHSYGFEFQEDDSVSTYILDSETNLIKNKRRYRPWRWLWPQTWTPLVGWNQTDGARLGLSFSGSDFSDHHQYNFQLEYLTRKNAVDFSFSYLWAGLPWDLNFAIALTQGTGQYHNTRWLMPYDYQVFTGNITASRTWNLMTSSHQLGVGFHIEYIETLSSLKWPAIDPGGYPPTLPSLGWMNALFLTWTWSNMRQSEKSIVPDSGYYISTYLRIEGPWLGAEHHALMGKLEADAAWTMPWLEGHVLSAKLSVGGSWADSVHRQPFVLSSAKGLAVNTADVAIHGYPTGLLMGQHFMYVKASYTAALWHGQIGHSTLPIGLSKLGASAFGEWGYAWSGNHFNVLHSKYAIGGKIYIDLTAGYRLPVRLTLGYAWGGAPYGGHHGFLLLGI